MDNQRIERLTGVAEACDQLAGICRSPQDTEAWWAAYAVAFRELMARVQAVPPTQEHMRAVNEAMRRHGQERPNRS